MQNEIDLQVKVTKEFRSNVQHFQVEQNKRKEELKEKLARNEISQQDYDAQVKRIDRQNLVVNVVAGGLLSPADSLTGVAVSAVSPAVSYEIGQYFKKEGKEGSFEHIATHAVIGALTSAANGGNALSGAVSAGGAEYIAQVTANTLFNKKAEDLTADEKQTVSSIAQLVGVVSGSVTGDSSVNAYIGGNVAKNAVDNNAGMDRLDGYTPSERRQKEFLSSCTKSFSKQECQRRFDKKEWENTKKVASTIADFIPIIGDIKGFAEAETKGDYFFATLALVPAVGDGAKKVHDAHKAYEAAKAVKDVEKMKAAMNDAVKGSDLPYNSQQIRTELEKRYNAGNVVSTTVPPANGKNVKLAGQRHPITGVVFDSKGFPIFDDFAAYDTKISAKAFNGVDYTGQMKLATQDLADAIRKGQIDKSKFEPEQLKAIFSGQSKIPDYTWHHHQDSGRMQLIPERIHRETGHIGGEAMSKGK